MELQSYILNIIAGGLKDQKAASLRTLGCHKPLIHVVIFLTPLALIVSARNILLEFWSIVLDSFEKTIFVLKIPNFQERDFQLELIFCYKDLFVLNIFS